VALGSISSPPEASTDSVVRVLVHSSIHDQFVERLAAEVQGLKMGDPTDPATDIGPVVSEAHLQKVRAAVEKAVSNGAQVGRSLSL
jgi:acyl-CoA reductase-like NAD-dependent aldehyde dehydrogenase